MTSHSTPPGRDATKVGGTRLRILAASVAGVVLAAGAIYGIGFMAGNGEAAACGIGASGLRQVSEAARGEVAAVMVPDRAEPLPQMSFVDGDGQGRDLSEWRGKVVLLNLWATWCAPCREEMPALDALQARMGGDDFEVVAVSLDRGDGEKPRKFLSDIGVGHLPLYRDPENVIFNTLKKRGKAFGLPTTLLIDGEGCEIGHMAGPADWSSGDARALIEAAVGSGRSG